MKNFKIVFAVLAIFLVVSVNSVAQTKMLSSSRLAQDTIKAQIPQAKIAFEYAIDNVFADILDHDSSVIIESYFIDGNKYYFSISAEKCMALVLVDGSTNTASKLSSMSCLGSANTEDNLTKQSQLEDHQDYILTKRKVIILDAKLIRATDLPARPGVAFGSKKFSIEIHFLGYTKETTPYFQNFATNLKRKTMLGGVYSTYYKNSVELVNDVKIRKGVAKADVGYRTVRVYDFVCPMHPGYDGAGCQFDINGQYSVYIENFYSGNYVMLANRIK